jgi:hypothetical protein
VADTASADDAVTIRSFTVQETVTATDLEEVFKMGEHLYFLNTDHGLVYITRWVQTSSGLTKI